MAMGAPVQQGIIYLFHHVYIIYLCGTSLLKERLNTNGRQFHQYQQNKQLTLNTDGRPFHQYQQN